MRSIHVVYLVIYAFSLSVGQIMFKLAAERAGGRTGSDFLFSLAVNPFFILAVLLYGFITLFWVWLLTQVPLSRAYPFVVLSFLFTPALSILLFRESLNGWYALGLALILSGLGIVLWKSS
ncbi:DMT family transporter [Govanella unica]|uniref:Transporter n=1 Tax=Govanella unica TaxID=2975056 RepID=A0A9X3TWZ6_9PROT|nr:hypothetical protein [Govania unica]MDA5193134.1 transporter [Govania unica]